MSDDFLERVTDFHGWGEISMAENTRNQLAALASQAKSVNGMAALFSGPPGTGKTLAASYVASKLGLPLYRVDIASVVSKTIGETEKNLDRLFEQSKQLEITLLFDEADPIFGKRSEVSDSHDRYANLETGYLLQTIENHTGLVILTSNTPNSIDDDFIRRMTRVIEFVPPPPRPPLPWWRKLLRRITLR